MSIDTNVTIIQWSTYVFTVVTALCLLILIVFGFFRPARPFIAVALITGSWITGGTVWILSALFTYIFWGVGWLIAGIVFMGVGVLPLALLASGRAGEWGNFNMLATMAGVTIALRLVGLFLMSKRLG